MAECNIAPELLQYDLNLHIGAIFILVTTSLLGSISPVLASSYLSSKPDYNSNASFVLRLGLLFSAGTILATGFIHMLLPSVKYLTDPCLAEVWKEDYTAFAGAFAMIAILMMQLIQFSLSSYYFRTHKSVKDIAETENPSTEGPALNLHADQNCLHTHNHTTAPLDLYSSKMDTIIIQQKVKRSTVFLLEAGIAIHSVIIGFALGVATGSEFTALLIALVFHQFFEGLALGSTIAEAQFDSRVKSFLMAGVYGITTPLGIGIGIAVRYSYSATATEALIVQGILDALSAGILIYTALVEFITPQITVSSLFRQQSVGRKIACFVALYAGAGAMALIGRWA